MDFVIPPDSKCLCHSGKKFRDCCQGLTALPTHPTPEVLWKFWSKSVEEVLGNLLATLFHRNELDEVRSKAERHFGREKIPSHGYEYMVAALDAFALFHMLDEEADEGDGDRIDSANDSFLVDMPPSPMAVGIAASESLFEREPHKTAFLELLESPFSWFCVVEVRPGDGLTLRDLLLDREIAVADRGASSTCNKGEIICAKILRFEGISLLAGAVPTKLPPILRPMVTEMAERVRTLFLAEFGRPIDEANLCCFARVVLSTFFKISLDVESSPSPSIQNTDGDPMSRRILEYRFRGPTVQKVAEAIQSVLDGRLEEYDLEIAKRDRNGHPTKILVPFIRKASEGAMMETVIIAQIVVERRKVIVEVNSGNRAERLRQNLARLGDIIEFVSETEVPWTDADTSSLEDLSETEMPAEVQALVMGKMAEMQERWITTPVPALKGMTPMQASRHPAMRLTLEALLDDFAIRETQAKQSGSGLATFDVEQLRTRLGFNNKIL